MPIEVDSISYRHTCKGSNLAHAILHHRDNEPWIMRVGETLLQPIAGCPWCLEPLPEFAGTEAARLGLEGLLFPAKRRRAKKEPRLPEVDLSATVVGNDALNVATSSPTMALTKAKTLLSLAGEEEPVGPGSGPYAILWGLPNWETPKDTVLAWLKENNISDERAERVALLLARKKGRRHSDPWEAFQKLVLPKLGP